MWAPEEYAKLPRYDAPTGEQPTAVFLCHHQDRNTPHPRVCGGWAACHDGEQLLALRIAVLAQTMTPEQAQAVRDYTSPVPLFASGRQAAEHGLAEIDHPGERARAAITKLDRVRRDLQP